ncbi:DUF2125 domain-containing protein [Pseudogemmobacter bohemicus]|uniref:DUF2125 domain-containing protein n=1 Tax=Pseudogemmobacter bohemicus TaxID=2250708 RepID=UPI000DD400D8|nr:DUF2125 domain-containing protein [Pseudogemmobacter bohemicus]
MTSSLRTSTALAGSFVLMTALAPMAMAQGVTAQELWAAWQDGVALAGGTLSAEESREGNRMILANLRLDMGDEAGTLQLEEMKLVNQADGSVAVILPDRFPLMFELPEPPANASPDAPGAADRPQKVFVTVDAPDLNLVVQGLGERAEFQAAAPKVTLTLDRFLPPLPEYEGEVKASAVLDGFGLRYLQDLATDVPMIDAALSFDGLSADMSAGKGADGKAMMAAKMGKSSAAFSGAMPVNSPAMQAVDAGMSGGDFPVAAWLALLDAGMRGNVSLSLGDTEFTGEVNTTATTPKSWDIGFATLEFMLGIDATKISYSSVLKGSDFLIRGDIPDFPADSMSYGIGEYRIGFEVGLNGLTRPQNWSAAYVMRDITMSDEMWKLVGNGVGLPQDPLTLALDLSGRYALPPEALKPGWVPGATGLPFTEFSFKINEMKLAGLGVLSAGQGGLGFDFSDLTTFDGLPLPSGRISVLTTGAYGLIDLMAKAGQIGEQEIQGARAALLMIGRAGEAPDTLHTEIDFREKGLFLNGIKIR